MEYSHEKILLLSKQQSDRFKEISHLLSCEEVIVDPVLTANLCKELALIKPVHELYQDYLTAETLADSDLKNEILQSLANKLVDVQNESQKVTIEFSLKNILPKQELLQVLINAYKQFCEQKKLAFNITQNKNCMLVDISGFNAKKFLESEVGVHRFISSSKQFDVMAFVYDTQTIPEINLKDDDIKIDVFRSNGAGGQHINKTDSAIRITHLKTNIVATCQDNRSQFQNKERAMEILKQKLLDYYTQNKISSESKTKQAELKAFKNVIVRTYDFDKNLVQDCRVNFVKKLTEFDGNEFLHLANILILNKGE